MKKTINLGDDPNANVLAIQQFGCAKCVTSCPMSKMDLVTNGKGILSIKSSPPDNDSVTFKFELPVSRIPEIIDALVELRNSSHSAQPPTPE